MADNPIRATAETQGISTTTGVTCIGTVSNAETVVWTESNQDLRNNPPLQTYWPTVDGKEADFTNVEWAPETQYVSSYSESIIADNGYTEFNGVQSVDTSNRVANQNNFASTEQFDYVASESAMGRINFAESLLLDGASQGANAGTRMLCPLQPATRAISHPTATS